MASSEVWYFFHGCFEEFGVPKPQNDTRCQIFFPTGMCADSFVHEPEKTVGIIVNLNIDVKNNMLVFRLEPKLTKTLMSYM